MRKKHLYIKLFSILFIISILSCSQRESMKSVSFFALDTVCDIRAKTKNTELLNKAEKIVKEFDKKYDGYKRDSKITKFNRKNLTKDSHIIKIVKKYNSIDPYVKKYFKLSIKDVIDLWDFPSGGHIPEKEQLNREINDMKDTEIEIRKNKILKSGPGNIELGGLLKGYLLDKLSEYFDKNDVNRYIINLGGDVAVRGKDIKVGIKDPRKEGVISYVVLEGEKSLKIVTSGDYERYFEKDGKRYHHILSPESGYPAEGINSLTYISKSGFKADIYSTALFAMGKKKALSYLRKIKKDGVLIIDSSNKFYKKNLKEGEDERSRLFYKYR